MLGINAATEQDHGLRLPNLLVCCMLLIICICQNGGWASVVFQGILGPAPDGNKKNMDPWICHMCKSSTLFLPPKLSIYIYIYIYGNEFEVAPDQCFPCFDVPACGSLTSEAYVFVSIYTMAHNIFVGFDSVFIIGPSGHESLRIIELCRKLS